MPRLLLAINIAKISRLLQQLSRNFEVIPTFEYIPRTSMQSSLESSLHIVPSSHFLPTSKDILRHSTDVQI